MILGSRAELAGRVKLQISGGARGTIDYPWQDNMILDQGLNKLVSESSTGNHGQFMFFCFGIGSSSQAVSATDTDLIQPIYRLSDFGSQTYGWDEDGGYGWSRNVKTFARGVAAGNISELTTGDAAAPNRAFARALVRDVNGNPTTITVLSDEILTITWEVRRWWIPATNHVITYTIDGVEYNTTASYKTIAELPKDQRGLGSGGTAGFGGELISTGVAVKKTTLSESQWNPSIGYLTPPSEPYYTPFPYAANYATLTPPIPKTNEFKCDINWLLQLTRRAP